MGRALTDWRSLWTDGSVEITLVSADPLRASWLAHWHRDVPVDDPTDAVDLLRPSMVGEDRPATPAIGDIAGTDRVDGGDVAIRATGVRRMSIQQAIDLTADLVGADPTDPFEDLGPTARFVATTIALALDQIGRGLIQPGLSPSGVDCWRLSGHGDELTATLADLARSCPAGFRSAEWSGDGDALLLQPPDGAVDRLLQATIDRFPRTAGAPLVAGHEAFAVLAPTTIDPQAAARAVTAVIGDEEPLLTLRLQPTPDSRQVRAVLVLQSRRDPSLIAPLEQYWSTPPEFRARSGSTDAQITAVLGRAARVWPRVNELLEVRQPTSLMLDDAEVDTVLGPVGRRLGAVGLSVIAPPDLFPTLELQPRVATTEPRSAGGRNGETPPGTSSDFAPLGSHLDLAGLLELRWQSSLDGIDIGQDELDEIIEQQRSVVRFRDRWVRLEPSQLDRLEGPRSLPASSAIAAALGAPVLAGGTYQHVDVSGTLAELAQRFVQLDNGTRVEAPAGLHAELRPYQERGLAWLAEMTELQLGGILADDMGLGKTIQIIALHLLHVERSRTGVERSQTGAERSRTGHAPMLVVCPASVVGNWQREFARFAPEVDVLRFHGADRCLGELRPGKVVLTTYGIARRDAALLAETDWGIVVADEAQAIKNHASRTARALRSITCRARFALTGTPVQNHLLDLWSLLDWTTPGLLGPAERFRQEFVAPVERGEAAAASELNRLLRPFVLRRRKTDPDIAPDLPPKTETDEIVPLTVEQAALYRAVVEETMAEIATARGIGRQGLVLRLVTRLKQVCNHPCQLIPDDSPTGTGEHGLAGRSGKLDRTAELIEEIAASGDACLLFTQYVAMGRLLDDHLRQLGFRTLFFHGGLSPQQRDDLVARFQNGEADVLVVSLRAGGTGLNLTAATHVIHYDRWWNPAIEDQASDRAWRIGQDRPVQVHRLISEGTIEDRIAALLADKRMMAEAVVGSGEAWISQLADDDLAALVALADGAGSGANA